MSPLLEIGGICKIFGGLVALDGVDLSVDAGSLTCIIGPNGCGKTTLFNVVSGAFAPTAGRVRYAGVDITGLPTHLIARKGVARKFQVPGIYPSLSVAENLGSRCGLQNFDSSTALCQERTTGTARWTF